MANPLITCLRSHAADERAAGRHDVAGAMIAAADEIERLSRAIYAHGESPMHQRLQIDPVDYLHTRYTTIYDYNRLVDYAGKLEREVDEARKAARELLRESAPTDDTIAWYNRRWPWLEEE